MQDFYAFYITTFYAATLEGDWLPAPRCGRFTFGKFSAPIVQGDLFRNSGQNIHPISRVNILQIELYLRRRIHTLSLLTYVAK